MQFVNYVCSGPAHVVDAGDFIYALKDILWIYAVWLAYLFVARIGQ